MLAIIGFAVGTLVLSSLIGVVVVVALPANYLSGKRSKWGQNHPAFFWSLIALQNLVGIVLIVAGVMMLVLPGPGILAIFLGLMMTSIPGKRKLIASLVGRTKVLKSANRLRDWFGRPPLVMSAPKS